MFGDLPEYFFMLPGYSSSKAEVALGPGTGPAQSAGSVGSGGISGAEAAFYNNPKAVARAVAATIARITAAGAVALAALANPLCAGLFNIGGTDLSSPATLLPSILNGSNPSVYFTEEFIPGVANGNGYNQTNAVTQFSAYSMQNGQLTFVGYSYANTDDHTFAHMAVAFNFSPWAPFNTGTVIDNAITMLHELGHVYDGGIGQGSTMLVNDSGSAAASAFNTDLIRTACFH